MNLTKYYKPLFFFSAVILVFGVVSLFTYGLRLGIDFKGGTVAELEFQEKPEHKKFTEKGCRD